MNQQELFERHTKKNYTLFMNFIVEENIYLNQNFLHNPLTVVESKRVFSNFSVDR